MAGKFDLDLIRGVLDRPWRVFAAVMVVGGALVVAVVLIRRSAAPEIGKIQVPCTPGMPLDPIVFRGFNGKYCPPEGYVLITPVPVAPGGLIDKALPPLGKLAPSGPDAHSPCSPEGVVEVIVTAHPEVTVVPVGKFDLTKCAYPHYLYSTASATPTPTSTATLTPTPTLTPLPIDTRKPKEGDSGQGGGCGPNGCGP